MVAIKEGIKLGDHFAKVDAPTKPWVVMRFLTMTNPIPHVQLHQKGKSNRQITLSVAALSDKRLYRRVDEAELPSPSRSDSP